MNDSLKQLQTEEFPSSETKKHYKEVVSSLFKKAESRDKKEFMSAILYFKGLFTYKRGYNVSRELEQTVELFFNLQSNSQILSFQSFLKLGLLVYCHIIETYPTFEFLFNLALVAQGKDYQLHPFGGIDRKPLNQESLDIELRKLCKEKNFDKQKQLISKLSYKLYITDMPIIARIQKVIKESKKAEILLGEVINDYYDKDIRNAFSHGLYGFDDKGMMLIKQNKHISYRDLLDKISKCLHFYVVLVNKTNDTLQVLPKNKTTKFSGKLGDMTIKPIVKDGFMNYHIKINS